MCWCYGLLSIILGIIAIVPANQGEREYQTMPNTYSLFYLKNLIAGKICAIIGICVGGLYIIFIIAYFLIVGSIALGVFNAMHG